MKSHFNDALLIIAFKHLNDKSEEIANLGQYDNAEPKLPVLVLQAKCHVMSVANRLNQADCAQVVHPSIVRRAVWSEHKSIQNYVPIVFERIQF